MAKTTLDTNVVNFHREVSLMFLKSTSAFAVRTPRGQKEPGMVQWDPKNNTREKSNHTLKILEETNDNLGVHLFGPVVDVDVDTDNPHMTAALDYFLPPTSHVWGRASRPRTHRLYELGGMAANFTPSDYPFLSRVKEHDEVKVEVRGGEQRNGQYSLLPGSIHPSGEMYEWEDPKAAKSTPIHTDVIRLMDGIRLACVAALIVPHWTEGVRNELCKALSGFMYKAAAFSAELNIDMPFDRDSAKRLLDGIMVLADDDPSDKAMREKTFEQTWQKGEQGEPITGATRIGELAGNPDIVPLLYALLAHTPDMQQMDEVFEQYAVMKNTTNILDLSLGAYGNYVMNKEAFVFTMAGRFITTARGRVPISSVFMNSMQRTIVDQVGVNPDEPKIYVDKYGLKTANIWSGWGIDPHPDGASANDVLPFLDYLYDVVCQCDDGLYDWTLQWLADIFQNPSNKPGTALVLVGKQGSGKSFLGEKILKPIIGKAHFAKVGTLEKLTNKFNAHLSGKLVVQGEEVMNSNRRLDADAMKDQITSQTRTVEHKGRDSFDVEDHTRYLLTSNRENNAVSVEQGDRRHTIIKLSDKYAYINPEHGAVAAIYWDKMHKWVEEKDDVPHRENLAKLHAYFRSVPIRRATIRSAYETDAKAATRSVSSRGMDAWLLSMLEMRNPFDSTMEKDKGDAHSFWFDGKSMKLTDDWPNYVQYSRLEAALRERTAREFGEARSAQQIARFFRDSGLLHDTEEKRFRHGNGRVRARPFPSRTDISRYLKDHGYEILDHGAEDDFEDYSGAGPKF